MAEKRLRVSVISEEMAGPLDEGIRKFAYSLLRGLGEICEARGLSIGGAVSRNGVVSVPRSRTFFSRDVREQVRAFAPDIVCYVPSASITFFSLLRARVLKAHWPAARTILVALQPRRHHWGARKAIPLLRPDLVLTQGEEISAYARSLGCRTALLPPGVDHCRFRPVDAQAKRRLRRAYGLPEERLMVLHVGHVKEGRNVEMLARLQPYARTVLVAGRSTGLEAALVDDLRARGVVVIDRYLEAIEEVYQAADCFVFPTWSAEACIDVPLSVLEAMACNLAVVTTPFGGLPKLFRQRPGFRFAADDGEFVESVAAPAWMAPSGSREMVLPYSWNNVAVALLEAVQDGAL